MSLRKIIFSFLFLFLYETSLFAGNLKIAATISPLADIVRHVAGEENKVVIILPPDVNPHAYELNTKLAKHLAETQVIFLIGHELDDWVKKIANISPGARLVVVDQGIELINPEHSPEGRRNPSGRISPRFVADPNPHYWLSVQNAKIIASNVARTLTELDPSQTKQFDERLNQYLKQLNEADYKIKSLISSIPKKQIVTFHDSWPYFAKDYGLTIVGTVESCQDQGPTPKRLVHLSKAVKEYQISVLFSEPEVSDEIAESIAKDLNLRIYKLDPIGPPNKRYIDLMLDNAKVIQEAHTHE